jgi:hypothetical protein
MMALSVFPTISCLVPLLFFALAAPALSIDPWRNTSLPIAARVADLVSRLSLTEKGFLMSSTTPALDRLAIPAFNWGTTRLRAFRNDFV